MVYTQMMSTLIRARLQRPAGASDCDATDKYRSAFSAGVMHLFLLAAALCAAVALLPGRARAQASASAAVIGGGDPTAMVRAVIDQATAVVRDTAAHSNLNFTGQQFDGADYAEVHSSVMLKDQAQPIKVDYLVRRDGSA